MVLDVMYGVMVEHILDNGEWIRCMVKVNLNGQMDEDIKDNIKMIKKKEMEYLNGVILNY